MSADRFALLLDDVMALERFGFTYPRPESYATTAIFQPIYPYLKPQRTFLVFLYVHVHARPLLLPVFSASPMTHLESFFLLSGEQPLEFSFGVVLLTTNSHARV